MKIKYIGYGEISVITKSRNRYVFKPNTIIDIQNIKDIYELIRHSMHGHRFIIEQDPDFNKDVVAKAPGIVTSDAFGQSKVTVKINTKSVDGEDKKEKTLDEVVEDIDNLVKENKKTNKKTTKKKTSKKK